MITREDLIHYFVESKKDPKEHKIGMEYELFGFHENGKPLSFSGIPGVEQVLKQLAAQDQWGVQYEGERLLGLKKGKKTFSLEPGAQLELSTTPYSSLIDLNTEILETFSKLIEVTSAEKIFWVALGLHPFSSLREIEWIPKKRYEVMSRFFSQHGGALAHLMMKQTASIQINIDYADEKEAINKFRLLMALAPIVTAIFANSSMYEGKRLSYLSYRSRIWQQTDPARCGLIRNLFNPHYSIEEYVDFVLQIPMIFLKRGEEWIEPKGLTFAQFLKRGEAEGGEPTIEDWKLHLSTVFTEVRLKQVLELRSADSNLPDKAMALAAFVKGLTTDSAVLAEAWNCLHDWTWEERLKLYEEVPKYGLQTRLKNDKIIVLARELAKLGEQGLTFEEKSFLYPIFEILDKGKTLAEEAGGLHTQRLGHENGIRK